MRKLLIACIALPGFLWAQPDEETVYYTDSDVKNSRFGLALNVNPVWTDLRIISDELGLNAGGITVDEDEAMGTFQLNYHMDLIYKLNQSFEISVGFGQAFGGYRLEGINFFGDLDTILVDDEVDVSMYTVPIKINFNSSISDVFDLEVVPMLELNFISNYQANFTPLNNDPRFSRNFSNDAQSINYSVGLALGGTFWLSDNWGLFVRGGIKYMLNQMIDLPDFPRETLINYGGNVGVRYNF